MSEPNAAGIAKNCSRCARPLECGINLESCWCGQYPRLDADRIDGAADCLCPACLRSATDGLDPTEIAKSDE